MLNILTIIGARPQIIKAAAISRAINENFTNTLYEKILHTGQHYDNSLSQIFFDELGIPFPDYNLKIGSASHGVQSAKMIKGIEEIINSDKPDLTLVYGDTNSTLSAALASSKLKIPVVHIEAGLRSFNKTMPEEINRIVCDHVSTLLFAPTITAINNLKREGFNINSKSPYNIDMPGVFHCGDIMYDNSLYFAEIAKKKSMILKKHNLFHGGFYLVTIHRDNNTDNPDRLNAIFDAIFEIQSNLKSVFFIPLHPRTLLSMKKHLSPSKYQKIFATKSIIISEPVSFLDMIMLEKNAALIITDSGGVQKEAYFFKKPCLVLRSETEWVELVENKAAWIVDADMNRIINCFNIAVNYSNSDFSPIFGDGRASIFICQKILECF